MSEPYDPSPTIVNQPGPAPKPIHPSSISGHTKITGHAIWTWDVAIAVWILIEDKSEAGFEPGDGPTGPGRFHGQSIRWACRPKRP